MAPIIGALLVIPIVSVVGAATGAAVTDKMRCLSPLEVVGLDNCPELKSDGRARNNSILENLLAIKADMLRQVTKVLTNPVSAGQGGRLDEPLLLVMKLAGDEADAIFGESRRKYLAKYYSHVAHAGTWSSDTGGFNRWVETYHRKALHGTRPVLIAVHGDHVCALEKELSLEARMNAAGAQAEQAANIAGEGSSEEAATLLETSRLANNSVGREGRNNNTKHNLQTHLEPVTENFEIPVALMTLGWDPSGDPTHHGPSRDRSCALRMLGLGRVVTWFTSHRRSDSHTHEKFRYLPIGFGGFSTRNGLPQTAYIDAVKRQLDILEKCPVGKAGRFDLLFQCSNLGRPRDGIWKEMAEGKELGSPIPVNRFPLEPADYVTAAARGIFAVSPPGSGPDCFRHYEMMLEGNIALVPDDSSLRSLMDGLPAFFFGGPEEAWGSLTCGHLLEMAETVQAKIKEGKQGGGGLQFEKLTHGFWRRYIRREVLLAGGDTDENKVYVERSVIHPDGWPLFVVCLLAMCVLSTFALWRVKGSRACGDGSRSSGTADVEVVLVTGKDIPAEAPSCDYRCPSYDSVTI